MPNNNYSNTVTLRPVKLSDAKLLLTWRNDDSTRLASKAQAKVEPIEHTDWLDSVLANPKRLLYIGESQGVPIGTVRADYLQDYWELSWSVANDAREKGFAKEMVSLLLKKLKGSIRAEIKKSNLASIKIAKFIGMRLQEEKKDTFIFTSDINA